MINQHAQGSKKAKSGQVAEVHFFFRWYRYWRSHRIEGVQPIKSFEVRKIIERRKTLLSAAIFFNLSDRHSKTTLSEKLEAKMPRAFSLSATKSWFASESFS